VDHQSWLPFALLDDGILSNGLIPLFCLEGDLHTPLSGKILCAKQVTIGPQTAMVTYVASPDIWQYKLEAVFGEGFSSWLSSSLGLSAFRYLYWWVVAFLSLLLLVFTLRRAIASIAEALWSRDVDDTHPAVWDALIIFVLGPSDGQIFIEFLVGTYKQAHVLGFNDDRVKWQYAINAAILQLVRHKIERLLWRRTWTRMLLTRR
jgi:hypothetical protein